MKSAAVKATTGVALGVAWIFGLAAGIGAVVLEAVIFGPVVAAAIALGALLPALIASGKGRSFFSWWLFGVLALIVALPAALIAKDWNRVRCPHCAEEIRQEATVCPHCQRAVAATAE